MKATQTTIDAPSAPGRLVKVRRESTDTMAHRALGWVILGVLFAGVAVEAALGVRVWAQVTGNASPSGLSGMLYGFSDTLVGPFHGYEPSKPIQTTSILEIASLVAMVAYMAVTVVSLVLLTIARYTFSHLAARGPRSVWLPAPAGAHSSASSAIRLPRSAAAPPVAAPARPAVPATAAVVRDPLTAESPTPSVAM